MNICQTAIDCFTARSASVYFAKNFFRSILMEIRGSNVWFGVTNVLVQSFALGYTITANNLKKKKKKCVYN